MTSVQTSVPSRLCNYSAITSDILLTQVTAQTPANDTLNIATCWHDTETRAPIGIKSPITNAPLIT